MTNIWKIILTFFSILNIWNKEDPIVYEVGYGKNIKMHWKEEDLSVSMSKLVEIHDYEEETNDGVKVKINND